MNPSNGPVTENMDAWMRKVERQILTLTRRPQITHASQILGPGVAPFAVEIKDWNGAETEFNGFFYSRTGSFNSPDGTKWWIGQVIAQREGFGIMRVWDYRGVSNPPTERIRRWSTTGSTRVFSVWT